MTPPDWTHANSLRSGLAPRTGDTEHELVADKGSEFTTGFDAAIYNDAKPHFEAALAAFQSAGKTLVDLFEFLINNFGEDIKVYAVQFAKDEKLTRNLRQRDVPPRRDLTTDVFLQAAESQLVGYKMIFEVSGQRETLDAPWPPSTMTDEELERLKERINQCLPVDGIFMDLWDWDVHFENLLEDDWYFATVFGDASGIENCARQLAEFFLLKCDEYGLDYDQWHRQEEFASETLERATVFLQDWRRNVVAQYGLGMPTK